MSGGAVIAIALGGVVIATLLALFLARNITVQVDPEADYADLVPAPDAALWRVGDERTAWLSTNRHFVDVRIDSIGVGLGTMRARGGGQPLALGRLIGCVGAAVSGIAVSGLTPNYGFVTITVDYASHRPGYRLMVYYRIYRDSETRRMATPTTHLLTVPASGPLTHSFGHYPMNGGRHYIDVSLDRHFPAMTTLTLSFVHGEGARDVSISKEEEIRLLEKTGVDLLGCHEHEDVLITLYGKRGEELNRYFVDVLEAPTPTPVPPAVLPPDFVNEYASLRFCADAAKPRRAILSGGELVGSVTATGKAPLAYSLGSVPGRRSDYAFFKIDPAGAVIVSDLGADDTTGMDGSRLYSLSVRATDANGLTGEAAVAVQLSLAPISRRGDGRCP